MCERRVLAMMISWPCGLGHIYIFHASSDWLETFIFFSFYVKFIFFNWFFYIFKNYFFSAFNIRLLRVGLCYFFRCGHYRLMTWIMDMRCKPKLTLVFFLKRILYVFFFLIFAFDFEFLKY
jgi:hypothetical protein